MRVLWLCAAGCQRARSVPPAQSSHSPALNRNLAPALSLTDQPPPPILSPSRARVGVQKVLRREFATLLRTHVELAVKVRAGSWVLR